MQSFGSQSEGSAGLEESKYWGDSGVGSSSERTSTSYFSVSDGIRIYEEEIARHHLRSSLSVDSLLLDEAPGQARRLERSVSPTPPPSRRAAREQKKVTYAADLKARRGESSQHELILCRAQETNEDSVNDNEEDLYSSSIPRLPSVKDLAAIFQPRLSPEAKPRKSLMKVCSVA